jgi:hypothetical protein
MKKISTIIIYFNIILCIGCVYDKKISSHEDTKQIDKNSIYKSFDKDLKLNKTEEENLIKMYRKSIAIQKNIAAKRNQKKIGQQNYVYSKTIYFDNTFPKANICIHVSYNVDLSSGTIIEAEAKSTSYGYSIGKDYLQINSFGITLNGLFVFEITGKINNSQTIKYFGFIQKKNNSKEVGADPENDTEGWVQQNILDN